MNLMPDTKMTESEKLINKYAPEFFKRLDQGADDILGPNLDPEVIEEMLELRQSLYRILDKMWTGKSDQEEGLYAESCIMCMALATHFIVYYKMVAEGPSAREALSELPDDLRAILRYKVLSDSLEDFNKRAQLNAEGAITHFLNSFKDQVVKKLK